MTRRSKIATMLNSKSYTDLVRTDELLPQSRRTVTRRARKSRRSPRKVVRSWLPLPRREYLRKRRPSLVARTRRSPSKRLSLNQLHNRRSPRRRLLILMKRRIRTRQSSRSDTTRLERKRRRGTGKDSKRSKRRESSLPKRKRSSYRRLKKQRRSKKSYSNSSKISKRLVSRRRIACSIEVTDINH